MKIQWLVAPLESLREAPWPERLAAAAAQGADRLPDAVVSQNPPSAVDEQRLVRGTT
jgi:hypothetical protein